MLGFSVLGMWKKYACLCEGLACVLAVTSEWNS
jgi:hypothetical protein